MTIPMIRFLKLFPDSKVEQAYEDDAGFDLFSRISIIVCRGNVVPIPTGIAAVIPVGHVGLLQERSSLGLKRIALLRAGIIDSGYRGEIRALVHNLSDGIFEVKSGMKIAQLIVVPCLNQFQYTVELPASERQERGFGSSGA